MTHTYQHWPIFLFAGLHTCGHVVGCGALHEGAAALYGGGKGKDALEQFLRTQQKISCHHVHPAQSMFGLAEVVHPLSCSASVQVWTRSRSLISCC